MAQYKLGYACALWHDYLSYSIRVRSVILTSWQDHDHIFAFLIHLNILHLVSVTSTH